VLAHHRLAAVGHIGERNFLAAAAIQNHLLDTLGQPRERPLEIEADVLREASQHLEIELVAPVPTLDAPEASESCGKATTRFGSKKVIVPSPSQRGHAPIGLLKEKRRGSSSASE
jgi:hypothetical protein